MFKKYWPALTRSKGELGLHYLTSEQASWEGLVINARCFCGGRGRSRQSEGPRGGAPFRASSSDGHKCQTDGSEGMLQRSYYVTWEFGYIEKGWRDEERFGIRKGCLLNLPGKLLQCKGRKKYGKRWGCRAWAWDQTEARPISHGDVFNPKNWPSTPAENHGSSSMG